MLFRSASTEKSLKAMIGDVGFLRALNAESFTNDDFGLPTVTDIISELEKPGHDPRPEFKMAAFKDGVEEIKDLKEDMILEGSVTNVTNFGAFIDIGVHQDGLAHISELADQYVSDPHTVVKAGDIVKVRVLEVDQERRRIALSLKLKPSGEKPARSAQREQPTGRNQSHRKPQQRVAQAAAPQNNAMASAFAKLKL